MQNFNIDYSQTSAKVTAGTQCIITFSNSQMASFIALVRENLQKYFQKKL